MSRRSIQSPSISCSRALSPMAPSISLRICRRPYLSIPNPPARRRCISRLRCAVGVLLGVCLLSWTLRPARAQSNQGLERNGALRCASTGDAIPSGLVVLLPSGEKNYRSLNLQVLNNPFMSGVAVQIN